VFRYTTQAVHQALMSVVDKLWPLRLDYKNLADDTGDGMLDTRVIHVKEFDGSDLAQARLAQKLQDNYDKVKLAREIELEKEKREQMRDRARWRKELDRAAPLRAEPRMTTVHISASMEMLFGPSLQKVEVDSYGDIYVTSNSGKQFIYTKAEV
jgi:hypothetical protein